MKLRLEIEINDTDLLNLLETEDLKPSELRLALTPMLNGQRMEKDNVMFRPELFWFDNNEYQSADWLRIAITQIQSADEISQPWDVNPEDNK